MTTLYYSKDETYSEIVGGSINVSIENVRTRVMAYGNKKHIETTFVETGAHNILKKDWDTSLEASWDADQMKDDAKYADVWRRYKLNATDDGETDATWSTLDKDDNNEAEKGFRNLSRYTQEDNDASGGKKEGMFWVNDGSNWETGLKDGQQVGFQFSSTKPSGRPFVKVSGTFSILDSNIKEKKKALTCSFESNLRLFKYASHETFSLGDNPPFVPFTTRVRDRYVLEKAVNSQRTKPDGTVTNTTVRDDSDNLQAWANNQLERVAQQDISGTLILAGIQTDMKAGEIVDFIQIDQEATIPLYASIVSLTYNLQAQTTTLQIGRI